MGNSASVEKQFVELESPTAPRLPNCYRCQGAYWTPAGKRPKTAFIASHYNGDFTDHYLGAVMAERGYGFLGWNTRFRGAEDLFLLESALIDIGAGVSWLRRQGVEQIILLGNSGGGSLMAAYQAEAQNHALAKDASAAAQEALQSLEGGQLYISVNSHLGRPEVLTNWLDASVIDETDPVKTDESLNPFNPDNGPPYSEDFIDRYRAAQRARNQRITDWAKQELARLNEAGIPDRTFPLFRAWADLRFMDPAIDPSTRQCPGCYWGDPQAANRGLSALGRSSTLKTWLSMWSLETSQCRGGVQLGHVALPSLVIQGTGDKGVFPSDAEIIFEALGAKDKTLEMTPGGHYFEDDSTLRPMVGDMIAEWTAARI